MWKRYRHLCLLIWGAAALAGHPGELAPSPAEVADRARELARGGSVEAALQLYRQALAAAPGDLNIRADYATVLGWAEQWEEAIHEFETVLRRGGPQPAWVMRELARSELFGGYPGRALATLDDLIRSGDGDESTLCRKGLALRWLNRPREAEQLYGDIRRAYPDSTTALLGMIYSVADQDQLERALAMAERALAREPQNWELLRAKGQILNWLGRHQAAMRIFEALPSNHLDNREVLEGLIAAGRWGGDPGAAKQAAAVLVRELPNDPAAHRLHRDLWLDYGRALAPSFRFATDSDGFTDRIYEQDFAFHAGAANRFQFGFQQRQFSMDQDLAWRRFDLGWSGNLSRRWSAYASAADVEYTAGVGIHRFIGDAALSYAVGDRLKLGGGGGSMAMDAYQAVQNRVTASFYYGEVAAQPSRTVALEARYAHYQFSDGVARDRLSAGAFRRVYARRRLRIDVGGKSDFLRHNFQTADFFSPTSFYAALGEVRASGRISPRLEYVTEFGAGAQREFGYAVQSPWLATGSLFVRLSPRMMIRVDAGHSTSSMERINNGRAPYSRSVVAVSLVFRFE